MAYLFCIGFGYSARSLAALAMAQGWRVGGTTRAGGQVAGIETLPYHTGEVSPALQQALAQATHILISIPLEERAMTAHADVAALLKARSPLTWLGLFSTTGVYGDHKGGWVDETTPTHATDARIARRIADEQAWLAEVPTLPVHVFRLSGIYGEGRSAIEQVQSGHAKRIEKPNQFFSRIHVEDIARTVWASMQKPRAGEIYNVADDLPTASHEPITYACELLGVIPPPMIQYDPALLSPMAQSFYAASRKVSNKKVKEELRVVLKYPSYREGLTAIAQAKGLLA